MTQNNSIAVVYHRTDSIDTINQISISGIKFGRDGMYGDAVYSTYDLDSQMNSRMNHIYGSYIIKCKAYLSKVIILDYDNAKRVYGKEYTLIDQCKSLGISISSNIWAISNELDLGTNFSSDYALRLSRELSHDQIDGILYIGSRDGKVLVAYNPNSIIPLSYNSTIKHADELDTEKWVDIKHPKLITTRMHNRLVDGSFGNDLFNSLKLIADNYNISDRMFNHVICNPNSITYIDNATSYVDSQSKGVSLLSEFKNAFNIINNLGDNNVIKMRLKDNIDFKFYDQSNMYMLSIIMDSKLSLELKHLVLKFISKNVDDIEFVNLISVLEEHPLDMELIRNIESLLNTAVNLSLELFAIRVWYSAGNDMRMSGDVFNIIMQQPTTYAHVSAVGFDVDAMVYKLQHMFSDSDTYHYISKFDFKNVNKFDFFNKTHIARFMMLIASDLLEADNDRLLQFISDSCSDEEFSELLMSLTIRRDVARRNEIFNLSNDIVMLVLDLMTDDAIAKCDDIFRDIAKVGEDNLYKWGITEISKFDFFNDMHMHRLLLLSASELSDNDTTLMANFVNMELAGKIDRFGELICLLMDNTNVMLREIIQKIVARYSNVVGYHYSSYMSRLLDMFNSGLSIDKIDAILFSTNPDVFIDVFSNYNDDDAIKLLSIDVDINVSASHYIKRQIHSGVSVDDIVTFFNDSYKHLNYKSKCDIIGNMEQNISFIRLRDIIPLTMP
jgi:hypothetical protein